MRTPGSHQPACPCLRCYGRKTLPATFVVIFDSLLAIFAACASALCKYMSVVLAEYCPRSLTKDTMTQALVTSCFFACAIILAAGIKMRLSWTLGMHILKDGLFLMISIILILANVVTISRSGGFTWYDGAVLGSVALFAGLHAWFIVVMVSLGNYILVSAQRGAGKRYGQMGEYGLHSHPNDVYL